jgi:glutamyl-tRNA synthetase
MNVETAARKHALKNAFDYGEARIGKVIGKVIGECPDAAKDLKAAMPAIKRAVEEVNALPRDAIEEELSAYEFEEKKEREGLPPIDLETANTRVAPNPSGVLHVGHARAIILNDEYARQTNGKFFLRLEDTDPKTKKPLPDAYDRIPADLDWLGCEVADVVIQSDRLQTYYDYAEQLIEAGNAYVCDCPIEVMREKRAKGEACACRDAPGQMTRWKKMFDEYPEGGAILRVKTSLDHPNSSVRDWPAFRIVSGDHPRHPETRVWPLYNFACPIDDHEYGVNLVIRGKEHELNAVKQRFVYEYFNWVEPQFLEYGLIKVPGLMAHKSEILKGIREGRFTGWDDVRLPTLAALRRRGISPKAIRKYIVSLGVNRSDSTLDWKKLFSMNKEERDAATRRLFFAADPVTIRVEKAPEKAVLKNHPKNDLGERELAVQNGEVMVSRADFDLLKGRKVRLKGLCNVVLEKKCVNEGDGVERGVPVIHWVSGGVKARVLKPDGSIVEGVAEPAAEKLGVGDFVQFERFGYCRLDSKNEFWFAHA